MKIKMLINARLAGSYGKRGAAFYKGSIYSAQSASSLPDWEAKGKIFVSKITKFGERTILLRKGEYVEV